MDGVANASGVDQDMGSESIITEFLNQNSPKKKKKLDASVESISDCSDAGDNCNSSSTKVIPDGLFGSISDGSDEVGDKVDDDGVEVSYAKL